MSDKLDAHALLEELRDMIATNVNIDWEVCDTSPEEEFKALLDFLDKRRPITEVHVAVDCFKGLINDVFVSKTDLSEPTHHMCDYIEPYDEVRDTGCLFYKATLEE